MTGRYRSRHAPDSTTYIPTLRYHLRRPNHLPCYHWCGYHGGSNTSGQTFALSGDAALDVAGSYADNHPTTAVSVSLAYA